MQNYRQVLKLGRVTKTSSLENEIHVIVHAVHENARLSPVYTQY